MPHYYLDDAPVAGVRFRKNPKLAFRGQQKLSQTRTASRSSRLKKLSPAAWRHIHLNGHYTFRGDGQVIDPDTIVEGLVLR
jgi:hypothetical protein